MSYDNTVPQAAQTIAFTQPIIQANFKFLDDAIDQEHNFDVTNATKTYHKQASMPLKAVDPVALPAGTNGMYYVGSDGEARFLTNALKICQLTKASQNFKGYQWIGQVLVQWGFKNTGTTSSYDRLLFATANIDFPTNCFFICTQPYAGNTEPSSQATAAIKDSTVDKFGFDWVFKSGSGQYTGFYWMAIGN